MSSALLSRSASPIPHPQPQVASPTPPPPLSPDSIYTSCYCEENIYLLAQTFTRLSESNATDRRGPWPWQIYVVFISNGGKTVALWNQKAARDAGVVVWDYHVVLVLLPQPVRRHALRPRATAPSPHAHNGPGVPHDHSGPGTHRCDSERSDRPESPPGDANASNAAAAFPQAPAPFHAPAPAPAPVPASASADSWTLPLPLPELGGGLGGGEGGAAEAWVYDFDTTLVPVPCLWRDYIAGTFPYAFDRRLADRIDERFHSLFRVIPADTYLDHFASDRSHMIVHPPAPRQGEVAHAVGPQPGIAGSDTDPAALDVDGGSGTAGSRGIDEGPRYSMPPPPYPPLCGAKARALGVTNNLMASFVSMSRAHVQTPARDTQDTPAPAPRQLHEGTIVNGPNSDTEATTDPGSVRSEGRQLPTQSLAAGYGQVMDMDGFVAWLAGPAGSENSEKAV